MGQYAVTTLNREQFETTVLKKEWYTYLRKKYHAEDRFPDVYDKLGAKKQRRLSYGNRQFVYV